MVMLECVVMAAAWGSVGGRGQPKRLSCDLTLIGSREYSTHGSFVLNLESWPLSLQGHEP